MARVDRDLEEIVEFCKKFSANLERISAEAGNLQNIGGQIDSSLEGTEFATRASSTISSTAKQVKNAADQGEARIKELQKRVENQIAERDRFR